jgi:DNA-binding FadR family transcriptional regulator
MTTARDEPIVTIPPLNRRETLAVRTATLLKHYILSERLEPGVRLPSERRLADSLSVSRVVLREALSQLMGEGLLERPSPYALCVAPHDRPKLAAELAGLEQEDARAMDLIQLRVILELGAVDAIVASATDSHLKEIERWVIDGERRLAAGEPFHRVDAGFHAALLKSLGNQVIENFLPLIEEHFRYDFFLDPVRMTLGAPSDQETIEHHRGIYEAIKRRDPVAARDLMLAHLKPYLDRGLASRKNAIPDG